MKSRTVLYLSYDGMTDPLGQSQVIPYLVGLAKLGHQITLVSFEKTEREYLQPKIAVLLENAGILWVPLIYTKKPPVVSTLWDIFRLRNKAVALHRKHHYDIVHCRSYVTALVGEWLQESKGIKFVFDMRGFWPDERVDGKIWDLEKPIYRKVYDFFKRKEQNFIANAAHIVSLTHNAADEIRSWDCHKYGQSPISVIPCCADLDLFDPARIDGQKLASMKKDLGWEDDTFVLLYLGAVGTWYMLPEMMFFFQALRKREPQAKFLFVTPEDKQMIFAEARRHDLPSDCFHVVKADREDVPSYIALADASVFFILPVFSKKASSPTKQGEIMAMGVPVVCNAGVGDTDYVLRSYHSGCLLDGFSEQEIERALDVLLKDRTWDKAAIRSGALAYYALEAGVQKYNELYLSL
jgi:glycosyltransferase involved in cell wall biosynthesis